MENVTPPRYVWALFRKGIVLPIGIFDSVEAAEKGKLEFKEMFGSVRDDSLYTQPFELNKVL